MSKTMTDYVRIFQFRSLPDDVKFWKACANGVLKELTNRNCDAKYIDETNAWKEKIDAIDDDATLDKYAEIVLDAVALLEKRYSDDATPLQVFEVYKMFATTVSHSRGVVKLSDDVRKKLEDALERAKNEISSLDSYADSIRSASDEAWEAITDALNLL